MREESVKHHGFLPGTLVFTSSTQKQDDDDQNQKPKGSLGEAIEAASRRQL
jgi:hypothetical protein